MFALSATVPGFGFDDEDLLEYDPVNGSWQLFHGASAAAAAWPATSHLDALGLPEPSPPLALAVALPLLASLAWRRQRDCAARPDGA